MAVVYFPYGSFGPICDVLHSNQNGVNVGLDIGAPIIPSGIVPPICPITEIIQQYRPVGSFGPVCDISWPDIDPSCTKDIPDDSVPTAGKEDIFTYIIPTDDYSELTKGGIRCKYDPILDIYFDCEEIDQTINRCIIQYGKWAGQDICARLKADFDKPPRNFYQKPPWDPFYCVDFDPPENIIEWDEYGNPKLYTVVTRSLPITYPVDSKHWKADVNKYAVWVNPMICNLHGVLQEVNYNVNFPTAAGTIELPKSKPRTYAVGGYWDTAFFNDLGVFIEPGNTTNDWNNRTWDVEWKITIPADGDYFFEAVADNAMSLYLNGNPIGPGFYQGNSIGVWSPVSWTQPLTTGNYKFRAEVTNFNHGSNYVTNPTACAIRITRVSTGTVIWDTRQSIGTELQAWNNEWTMLVAADDDVQVYLNEDLVISSTGCSACHQFRNSEPASLAGVPTNIYLWNPNTSQWVDATFGTYPDVTVDPGVYFDDTREYWNTYFTNNPSRTFIEGMMRLGNHGTNGNVTPLSSGTRGMFVCNGCEVNTYGPTTFAPLQSGTGLNGKVTFRADRIARSGGGYAARVYLTKWAAFGYNYQDNDVYQCIYTDAEGVDVIMGYVKLTNTVKDSFDLRDSIQGYLTVGLTGQNYSGLNDLKVKLLNTGGLGQNWTSYFPGNNLNETSLTGMSLMLANSGPVQGNDELRGFDIPGDGWKYIATGDFTGTFTANRSVTFEKDTRYTTKIRLWVRAGTDLNGHERPNDIDESLKLEITKSTGVKREVVVVPSFQNSGLSDEAYAQKYGIWHFVIINLENDERTSNTTFRLKVKAGYPPEYVGGDTLSASFNANGHIVVNGVGNGRVKLKFEWNDNPNTYGKAVNSISVGQANFFQTNEERGYAEAWISVSGGATYNSVITGNAGGFTRQKSNRELCFKDLDGSDCNALLTIVEVETRDSASPYTTQYPNGGEIYGIYRIDFGSGAAGFVGDAGYYWDDNPACWAIKLYNGKDFGDPELASGKPTQLEVHSYHPDRLATRAVTYMNGAWNNIYVPTANGEQTFTNTVAGTVYYQDFTLGTGGLKIRMAFKARCGAGSDTIPCATSDMNCDMAVVQILEPGYGYSVGDEFELTFNNGNKTGSFSDFSVIIAAVTDQETTGDLFWHTRLATGFDKYPAPDNTDGVTDFDLSS